MGSNRIQKLLFSEYSDMEDTVLVESPFAETSRSGAGLRQVQIAENTKVRNFYPRKFNRRKCHYYPIDTSEKRLTPTRLILAQYAVKPIEFEEITGGPDPDIDSFELVCAYPVESVNLSTYRSGRRKTIKASFCNGKVRFFEIGGWLERKMLWSVWCERVRYLAPYESATSVSETSVASSASSESLYIIRSSVFPKSTGQTLLWCHYSSSFQSKGSWDPHLYLGPAYTTKGCNSTSLPGLGGCTFHDSEHSMRTHQRRLDKEPCLLSAEYELLAWQAVEIWEIRSRSYRKPRRRWGLRPFPGLLSGLGLWTFSRAETFSLQTERSVSLVDLRDNMNLQLNKHLTSAQLVRTMSLESLDVPALCPDKLFQLADPSSRPQKCIDFWKSESVQHLEWKREDYQAQQKQLRRLRKSSSNVMLWQKEAKTTHLKARSMYTDTNRKKTRMAVNNAPRSRHAKGDSILRDSVLVCSPQPQIKSSKKAEGQIESFRKCSSSSLAHQLTMIDRHLFQMLSTLELGRVRKDKGSIRTPHLRYLLSFSYRISCLVASQILSSSNIKERALLIVKCVGVAYKCHKLQNLQTTLSVIHGLQCPAVYRLHQTWAYVRKHHASKYRRFEDLSKRYLDPRLPLYQRTFDTLSQTPPFLPCVELLAAGLLSRVPDLPQVASAKFSSETLLSAPTSKMDVIPTSVRRFFSAFNIFLKDSVTSFHPTSESHYGHFCDTQSPEVQLEDLDRYFAPVAESRTRRLLQDLDYFLEAGQAGATRYAIPPNPRVRSLLLQASYDTLPALMTVSRRLEPTVDTATANTKGPSLQINMT